MSEAPVVVSEAPVVVSGYAACRRIAAGGMAEVFVARHPVTNRQVALKLMKSTLSDRINARERFLREVKTLGVLRHENIVGIIDAGVESDRPFLVLEYVEGRNLRAHLQDDGALPQSRACAIALQVARALEHVHGYGVTHRDLKPENVLLTTLADSSERAVLIDFGIARAGEVDVGSDKLTETGCTLGTPHYMSPEQARGELDIGTATDMHALGALLYEMLTGDPAYPGETRQAALHRVLYHRPEPLPATIRVNAPELVTLVERCLEKPPDKRPTASQVVEVLQRLVRQPLDSFDSALQTHPEQPVAAVHAVELKSKPWLGRVASAIVMLAVGVGMGWTVRAVTATHRLSSADASAPSQVPAVQSADPVESLETVPSVISKPQFSGVSSAPKTDPSALPSAPDVPQLPHVDRPQSARNKLRGSLPATPRPPPRAVAVPSTSMPAMTSTADTTAATEEGRPERLAKPFLANPYDD
jgi:serine/threonine protein kinase